jgi:hypothetical protein
LGKPLGEHGKWFTASRARRVRRAADIIERGVRLSGWIIRERCDAKSGSVYLKLQRPDGGKCSVRIADHDNKTFHRRTNPVDVRTQPRDLLCALRFLRRFNPSPLIEFQHASEADRIAFETQQAEAMAAEFRRDRSTKTTPAKGMRR